MKGHAMMQQERRPFPWRCAKCGKRDVFLATIHHTAQVKHDNRLHTIELPQFEVPVCRECGEIVFDDMADEQISQGLREEVGLLTPEQIRTGLQQLGLNQRQLAEKLGTAEATVSRWCSGAVIQSRSMDKFLRAFFASSETREVLTQLESGVVLPQIDVGH